MLMPPLVRLTDSEVETADGLVPQVSDGIEDSRGVLEKVRSGRLSIRQEPLLPDLHIEPVHGNFQPLGQFWSSQKTGIMCPPVARRWLLQPGAAPDLLHGDQRHFVRAVGRAMAFAGEDSGDLVIGHTGADELEHPVAHFHASCQLGGGARQRAQRTGRQDQVSPSEASAPRGSRRAPVEPMTGRSTKPASLELSFL
jgi:hypothetical protein